MTADAEHSPVGGFGAESLRNGIYQLLDEHKMLWITESD